MPICTCPNCGHNFESKPKSEPENWIGRVFGKWTVKRDIGRIGANKYFECECECGNIKNIPKSSLVQGKSKSCGCARESNGAVLIGSMFGCWRVESEAPKQNGLIYYNCKCICGTEREVSKVNLVNGKSKSCGCIKNDESKSTRRNGKYVKPDYSEMIRMFNAIVCHKRSEIEALTNASLAEWLKEFDAKMIAEGKGAWIGQPNAVPPSTSPE